MWTSIILFLTSIYPIHSQEPPSTQLTNLDSQIADLQYCGKSHYDPSKEDADNDLERFTLIQTQKGTIYLSNNDGESFLNLTNKFTQALNQI